MRRAARLGVDIGRVIIAGPSGPHAEGEDTSFFDGDLDAMLRTPPVVGGPQPSGSELEPVPPAITHTPTWADLEAAIALAPWRPRLQRDSNG